MSLRAHMLNGKAGSVGLLLAFCSLFSILYSAFGAASPFIPAFIESRGISPEGIGLMVAAGTALRLVSAPVAGRIADLNHALRLTLSVCAVAAGIIGLGYFGVSSFWPLFGISLLHAAALAPITNLADALAVFAANKNDARHFEYGWVRGTGSAAFIVGSLAGGAVVAAYGLGSVLVVQSALLLLVPLAAAFVAAPRTEHTTPSGASLDSVTGLFRLVRFRQIVLIAALVLGSHAMHDTFAVIRWNAAGISPQIITVLWSMAVAAEVGVFFVLGPWLLHRFSPAQAIAMAALAGVVRWTIAAFSTDIAVLAVIQPLHGLTFALLHLASMQVLARVVPSDLAATGIAVYGTVGAGASSVIVTLASGWLFGRLGGSGFLAMSLLCASALPIAWALDRGMRADARMPE